MNVLIIYCKRALIKKEFFKFLFLKMIIVPKVIYRFNAILTKS